MYLTFDETDTELIARMQERFLELFTGLFGSLDIKKIEWRDLGYGHQPVACLAEMPPVKVGIIWPQDVIVAVLIVEKKFREERREVPLPLGSIIRYKWNETTLAFPRQPERASINALSVLMAAQQMCTKCDWCDGTGRYQTSDDYGELTNEFVECRKCNGIGWLND